MLKLQTTGGEEVSLCLPLSPSVSLCLSLSLSLLGSPLFQQEHLAPNTGPSWRGGAQEARGGAGGRVGEEGRKATAATLRSVKVILMYIAKVALLYSYSRLYCTETGLYCNILYQIP